MRFKANTLEDQSQILIIFHQNWFIASFGAQKCSQEAMFFITTDIYCVQCIKLRIKGNKLSFICFNPNVQAWVLMTSYVTTDFHFHSMFQLLKKTNLDISWNVSQIDVRRWQIHWCLWTEPFKVLYKLFCVIVNCSLTFDFISVKAFECGSIDSLVSVSV